jgi:hypothetical protein
MSERKYLIPMDRFDSEAYVEERVSAVPDAIAGKFRTTMKYLYMSDGPVNLPRDRLKASEPFLDEAELLLVRWLQTRTNGNQRKNYGTAALVAARRQRYRCEHCGHADVRVLNLDHVSGRDGPTDFACLCANCHAIKSRTHDWVPK